MPEANKEVRIGDRSIPIPRFNGYKASIAGEIISTISENTPAIQEVMLAFTREYEKKNIITISRAEARLDRYQRPVILHDDDGNPRMTSEGFVAIERVPVFEDKDFNAAGVVEIPSSPTTQEQLMAVFPMIWRLAREEVIRLLALVTAPNSELMNADEEGSVDDYLAKQGKRILHEGDLDQIVDVLTIGMDVLSSQFRNKPGLPGKIAAFLDQTLSGAMDAEPNASMQKSSDPESLTDSPAPTGGDEETPSTEQVGANLSGSAS